MTLVEKRLRSQLQSGDEIMGIYVTNWRSSAFDATIAAIMGAIAFACRDSYHWHSMNFLHVVIFWASLLTCLVHVRSALYKFLIWKTYGWAVGKNHLYQLSGFVWPEVICHRSELIQSIKQYPRSLRARLFGTTSWEVDLQNDSVLLVTGITRGDQFYNMARKSSWDATMENLR